MPGFSSNIEPEIYQTTFKPIGEVAKVYVELLTRLHLRMIFNISKTHGTLDLFSQVSLT
jgi:hypothetical protein